MTRNIKRWVGLCAVGGVVLACTQLAAAGDPQLEKLARQVVETSANINPGDVVVINGGQHTVDLMSAIATEVHNRGGMPTMFLHTDRELHRYADMPEKYLGQEPKYLATWLHDIDVWISVPSAENPKMVWGDIPESRLAKTRQSSQVIWDMLNEANVRLASIGYPTEEQAKINGLDFATYEKMHWNAVNTDYKQISQKGNYLRDVLKGSRQVRISTPSGTDLTLTVGNRPIFVDDGIVTKEDSKSKMFLTRVASLPGGAVFLAPMENSVQGKVVVPDMRCRFEPLSGVKFEFDNGQLTNFNAKQGGQCFEDTIAAHGGPIKTFGYVSIGLNPELKVMENPGNFRPGDGAGVIYLGIGNNELYGGNNRLTGDFEFPLVNATLEVDGRVMIKDGKLTF